MLIYVIRHGQTTANADGIIQGWNDFPLNEKGRELAASTGRELRDVKFDRCISSPLVRARETAQIVLRESGNDTKIETDERIKEIGFGEYELISTRSPEIQAFFDDPFSIPQFPGGEHVRLVMERTQEFLRELIGLDDDKTYLIATHGCALRAMLNFLYDDKEDFWQGNVPKNCCVNIIEAHEGKARLIARDVTVPGENLA